jgi:hypothetical protein
VKKVVQEVGLVRKIQYKVLKLFVFIKNGNPLAFVTIENSNSNYIMQIVINCFQ